MNAAAPFTPSPAAPDVVRAFAGILAGLAAVLARVLLRRPDLVRLTVPLWRWLNASVRRLERAVTQTGRVRAVVPPSLPRPVRAVGAVRLPQRRAWLVRELGWEVAGFGSQLQHLLSQDEMQALLAARPAVGRVLRPICRMLGIEVAGLKPEPPVEARVRPPRVRTKRERPWSPGPIPNSWRPLKSG